MKTFLTMHGQLLISIAVFLAIGLGVADKTGREWGEGRFGYVETAFAVQNLVLLGLILIRRKHRALEKRVFSQAVALAAFFSGLAFIGQPQAGGPAARTAADVITACANLLGLVTLLNLGRSFGILIALRRVRTGGLYRIVRHPMYATDILLRVGFLVSHFNLPVLVIFTASSACYVYRAVLEERFLAHDEEYRVYMAKVRYRFIPGVF